MRKRVLKFVLAIIFLSLPTVSFGQLITIAITANVTSVSDSYNLLEGNVSVGSQITGTYTYDTSVPDTDQAFETGYYVCQSLPCGITLNVGGVNFSSNPQNTLFTACITNAELGWLSNDSYGIRSYYNNSILNGVQINELSWALVDCSNTALSSIALPAIAPILSNWKDCNILSIGGGTGGTAPCYDKSFSISATVVSAVLVPEPISILFLSFGLLALRRAKK